MVTEAVQLAQYPFTSKKISVNGHSMAYLDEGEGPVVVCVHGNPSWSYLYRNVVSEFSAQYRFIVPDHIGCGFSDKPGDYEYTLNNHINNLQALLDHLKVEECVLMVHDWGGAIGMGWAGRNSDKVKGVVVLNTAAFRSQRIPFRIAVCRWPIVGDLAVRGLNAFAGAAIFMAVHKKMPREIGEGFLAPYSNWADRVAILRFVQDIPLKPDHPSWDTLVEVEQSLQKHVKTPMLICWGEQDFCFTTHFYEEWCQRFPQAENHLFLKAGHYVLEDASEQILPLVKRFLSNITAANG